MIHNNFLKSFYSLLPGLSSEVGHLFHYHLSTQRSVKSLGWKFCAIIPRRTDLPFIPDNWLPLLANDSWERKKGIFFRIYILLANVRPFRKLFQSIRDEKDAIVFLEQFELQHLGSLFFAILFLRPKFQFWLLHRYVYKDRSFKTLVYRFFHWYLEWKLGIKNVKYLTDSELLAKELSKLFKRPFQIVPIPHTEAEGKKSTPNHSDPCLFWWPGGSLREDKGLRKIQYLLDLLKAEPKARVLVADKGKEVFEDHTNLLFVPTRLSRGEYVSWMQKADLILLPYSAEDYSHRTSGIFVEAISLGAIPVTTEGTWMAYELNKFDLSNLIFNWQEPNLLDLLCHLKTDKKMLQRLEVMHTHYLQFHCEKGFGEVLAKI